MKKQLINEVRRMQRLAGLINEDVEGRFADYELEKGPDEDLTVKNLFDYLNQNYKNEVDFTYDTHSQRLTVGEKLLDDATLVDLLDAAVNPYEDSLEEAGFNISKNDEKNIVGGGAKTVADLAKKMKTIAMKLQMMKGIDTAEIKALDKLFDGIIAKIEAGNIGSAIMAADTAFKTKTKK